MAKITQDQIESIPDSTTVFNYNAVIPAAEIQTLSSAPITFYTPLEAGEYGRVITAEIENLGGTTGFDALYAMQVKAVGATNIQALSPTGMLDNATANFGMFITSGGTKDSIKVGGALQITAGGDSTALGDFDVYVSIDYVKKIKP